MKTVTIGDVTGSVSELVGTAEICRPPNNFFDAELIRSLADCYQWLEAEGARAIVLASAGKNFCAGADFTGRSAARRVDGDGGAGELYGQALRLFEAPLPVVAAVQGAAVGGGLGLACAADFRVASSQSRFSANFAMIGLHHGFGLTVTLPAIVGQQGAAELLYTGKRINGEEAKVVGLADRLVDAGELRSAAHDLAAEIASAAPLAVRAIRGTMREGLAERIKAATARELAEQQKLWPTADFAEGVKAAAERRSPNFTGQ